MTDELTEFTGTEATGTALPPEKPIIFTTQQQFSTEIPTKPRREMSCGKTMLIMLVIAFSGLVCGFLFCGGFFTGADNQSIIRYLTLKIKGGFFAVAANSFYISALWLIPAFIGGFCAIGQPAVMLTPGFKGLGAGIILAGIIKLYGVNGIPAFLLLILPGFAVGCIALAYQCRCALQSCKKLYKYIRGGADEVSPASFWKAYLYRSGVCLVLCLAAGLTDGLVALFADKVFLI